MKITLVSLPPAQSGFGMRFSYPPKLLDVYGRHKSIGSCRGWKPKYVPDCSDGYTTDDIFFLEVCLFNQMCANGHVSTASHQRVGTSRVHKGLACLLDCPKGRRRIRDARMAIRMAR